MKKIIITLCIITSVLAVACNENNQAKKAEKEYCKSETIKDPNDPKYQSINLTNEAF